MVERLDPIRAFQRKLYDEYIDSLDLPETFKYVYGNPVQPVVPLDTATNAVMIIGRHPETVYARIGEERDVPVFDVPRPFPSEMYFDGTRPRVHTNGAQLEEAILLPLDLQRRQCWLTHLVHVFLFSRDQIEAYRRLGCIWPERETRSSYAQLAKQSLEWLAMELGVARPRVILTLGADVAGIVENVTEPAEQEALLDGRVRRRRFGDQEFPVIHLAEPGAVIRHGMTPSPWPQIHRERLLPGARDALRRYGTGR